MSELSALCCAAGDVTLQAIRELSTKESRFWGRRPSPVVGTVPLVCDRVAEIGLPVLVSVPSVGSL